MGTGFVMVAEDLVFFRCAVFVFEITSKFVSMLLRSFCLKSQSLLIGLPSVSISESLGLWIKDKGGGLLEIEILFSPAMIKLKSIYCIIVSCS